MSSLAHVVIVALLSLAAVCVASRRLLPSPPARPHDGPIFALPPAGLLVLGLLAAEAAGLPTALATVCVACALVAAGAGTLPPPRATLATPQTVTSEAITRTQEATHA